MENKKFLKGTKLDKNNLETVSGGYKIRSIGYLKDKKTAVITWDDGFTDCLEFDSADARESGMTYLGSIDNQEVTLDAIVNGLRNIGLNSRFWEFQGTLGRTSHFTMDSRR